MPSRNRIKKAETDISKKTWTNCVVAITGANGSLGKALTKRFRANGAYVIGLTHNKVLKIKELDTDAPNEWIHWECGKEYMLEKTLTKLDILILNHGINPQGDQSIESINSALEINALSSWRLIMIYEKIAQGEDASRDTKQLWINTSEAEIQPTLSPGYEVSKRLLGELTSLRKNNINKKGYLKIKKIILGPFKSELNPIGIMSADFVANQIIFQSNLNFDLIIVSPNPFTYLLMPIIEIIRSIYSKLTKQNRL